VKGRAERVSVEDGEPTRGSKGDTTCILVEAVVVDRLYMEGREVGRKGG